MGERLSRSYYMISIDVLTDMANASGIDVSDIEYDHDIVYSLEELDDIERKFLNRVFPPTRYGESS